MPDLRRQIKIEAADVAALEVRKVRIVIADTDVGKTVNRQARVIAVTGGVRRLDLRHLLFHGGQSLLVLRGCGRNSGGCRRGGRGRRRGRSHLRAGLRGFEFFHARGEGLDHLYAFIQLFLQPVHLRGVRIGRRRRQADRAEHRAQDGGSRKIEYRIEHDASHYRGEILITARRSSAAYRNQAPLPDGRAHRRRGLAIHASRVHPSSKSRSRADAQSAACHRGNR